MGNTKRSRTSHHHAFSNMSPITFKFFSPRGDCRRITYDVTPELATINELVDGMVEGRRLLTYRDSEGDVVLLKTSRDVAEAVNDARNSGAKSIKVQIRLVRECPRNSDSKATAANQNNRNKNHCGGAARRSSCHRTAGAPQWGRCWSRGLFGHPHRISVDLEGVSDEVEEIVKNFGPFFGIHVHNADEADQAKKEAAGESASDVHPSPKGESESTQETAGKGEDIPTAESVVTTPVDGAKIEAMETTPVKEAVVTSSQVPTTIEESVAPENADVSTSGFTFVENEPENDETEVAAPQTATRKKDQEGKPDPMDEKLTLLKEMGFELPQDVARNMIRELNGRMDLIVRALVANQK